MSAFLHKYLKAEDIRKLSGYEFSPKLIVEGYLSGRHRSHSRGSSLEFRDYRQYVPGDDIALIDWRMYARTDRHYLRTYELETNMECHIFLDSSASMGFGKKISKLDYASFFTAALCYLVIRKGDRVSLQIFDDKIRKFFEPGSTNKHLNIILNALEQNQPGNQTSIAKTLQQSFPLLKRRGTVVVISDFLDDPAEIFAALSPYLHRGFKVHLFHIQDPEELKLPSRGLTTFVDMETKQKVIAHTDSLQQEYHEAIENHINGLRELSVRRSVDYFMTRTDTHYFQLFDRLMQ